MSIQVIEIMLAKIDPKLLEQYESRRLPAGQTLKQIVSDYKKEKGKKTKITRISNVTLLVAIITSLCFLFISFCFSQSFTLYATIFLVFAIMIQLILLVLKRIMLAKTEILHQYESYLCDFENAATGLECPIGRRYEIYTEKTTHDVMVTGAEWVIRAKQIFNSVRLKTECDENAFERVFNDLRYFRKQLDCAAENIQHFGLKFNKRELFAEAQKRIDRQEQ